MAKEDKQKYRHHRAWNGAPVPDGQVLVPFWITREFKKTLDPCCDPNLTTWKFGGIRFLIGFAPIAEDAFEDYMKDFWRTINQALVQYRSGRCIIGYRANGMPRLCPKHNLCTQCEKAGSLPRLNPVKEAVPDSLDYTYCEDAFDAADPGQLDPADEALLEYTFLDLIEHLQRINPRYAEIATLGMSGMTPDEIIERLQLKRSRGYEEVAAALKHTMKYWNLDPK